MNGGCQADQSEAYKCKLVFADLVEFFGISFGSNSIHKDFKVAQRASKLKA